MSKTKATIWAGTKTGRRGIAWVVPQEQIREFESGPINYKKLCEDCLKSELFSKIKIKK